MYLKYRNENKVCWGSKRQVLKSDTHWHEFYEISFLFQGQATEIINGTKFQVSEGTLTLLSPNDFHFLETKDEKVLEYMVCCIREEEIPKELVQLLNEYSPPYLLNLKEADSETFNTIFELFLKFVNIKNNKYLLKYVGLSILSLCISVAAESQNFISESFTDKESYKLKSTKLVLQYINEHYNEKISRENIAEQFGFSPNYLSMLFKRITGTSLSMHIKDVRMQAAMNYLKCENIPIGEIINLVGYNSPSLFYKHFYQKFGFKPFKYKLSNKN